MTIERFIFGCVSQGAVLRRQLDINTRMPSSACMEPQKIGRGGGGAPACQELETVLVNGVRALSVGKAISTAYK